MLRYMPVQLVFISLAIGCGGSPTPDNSADEPEDPSASTTVEEADTPQPIPTPVEEGSWQTDTRTNPLDDSRTVIAALEASEGVGGIAREPIILVARCQSNTTEVYIEWRDYLGDDDLDSIRSDEKRVTYRFPPADAQTELWGVSTDDTGTFATNPIPFLRTLVESEQLVAQTIPYGESPSMAIFGLAGAEAAIAPIAEECNWTLDQAAAAQEIRERAEAEARAEAEGIAEAEREVAARLTPYENTSFPLSDLNVRQLIQSGRGAQAVTGLPDGVMLAYFAYSAGTASQINRLIDEQNDATVHCPRAEIERNGIVLVECAIR